MQPLEARLARIREAGAKNIPQDRLELMHRATAELVEAEAQRRAVGEGDTAPDFELPGTDGETVSLSRVLAEGPAVVTFFRGHW